MVPLRGCESSPILALASTCGRLLLPWLVEDFSLLHVGALLRAEVEEPSVVEGFGCPFGVDGFLANRAGARLRRGLDLGQTGDVEGAGDDLSGLQARGLELEVVRHGVVGQQRDPGQEALPALQATGRAIQL